MVYQVLERKQAKKIKQRIWKLVFVKKNSVNLYEMTWIRIRIKIKWILSTGLKKQLNFKDFKTVLC